MNNIKEFLGRASSRKFLLALFTIVLTVCNKKLNLGLEAADIYTIVGIAGTYILVEGTKDVVEASKA